MKSNFIVWPDNTTCQDDEMGEFTHKSDDWLAVAGGYLDTDCDIQALVQRYAISVSHIVDVEVAWHNYEQKFLVTQMVTWPMPTDDGGTYWETDVGSRTWYTLDEFMTHLKYCETELT